MYLDGRFKEKSADSHVLKALFPSEVLNAAVIPVVQQSMPLAEPGSWKAKPMIMAMADLTEKRHAKKFRA